MNPKSLSVLLAGFALLAGCAKKSAEGGAGPVADLVPATERSRHFAAVSQQLELGGTLYGYVEVDGDVLKLAQGLKGMVGNFAQMNPAAQPFLNQDYAALFTKLGFNDIKAMGISSVPDGTGFFRNRVFLYTPEGRHGLLAGLGGKPGPFAHLALAPLNADVYSESEMDLPAIYLTVQEVMAQVGGETAKNKLDETLKKAGEAATVSWLKLINAAKGHVVLVARFDADKTFRMPGRDGPVLPAFSFLLRVDGVAAGVEDALRQSKALVLTQEVKTTRVYELAMPMPFEGLRPVIVAEGSTLFIASTLNFLNECRTQKTNLGQDPEFQKALAHVGTEGNGIGFVSPRLFQRVRDLEKLNPIVPLQAAPTFSYILGQLPNIDRPLVTLRVNRPDGILVRSYWNRSLKQDLAVMSVYNPVTIGVLAAMAIPAFQKVRMASQDKAVLNNLRQFAAAGDQFFLERGGTTATYADLVGPTKYIKALNPVAGEDYRTLRYRAGQPLRVRVTGGRTIEYAP